MYECSDFSAYSAPLDFDFFPFVYGHMLGCNVVSCGFDLHFLMTNNVEHLMYTGYLSSLKKCLLKLDGLLIIEFCCQNYLI